MPAIAIIPYADCWPEEFRQIAVRLRGALGDLAVRIDHIGSTSVPGLAAKDVIDVQVSVVALKLAEPIVRKLRGLGYIWVEQIAGDHVPAGMNSSPEEWGKLFFKGPTDLRPVNLHVRVMGSCNQRYALLFRDYLRSHPKAAEGYATVKQQLARYHGDDVDAYYDVKDPVCDIIMAGAEDLAVRIGWKFEPASV
jgi:GrpB-like predicted nucleotidyltransferase (UPF0157 family)